MRCQGSALPFEATTHTQAPSSRRKALRRPMKRKLLFSLHAIENIEINQLLIRDRGLNAKALKCLFLNCLAYGHDPNNLVGMTAIRNHSIPLVARSWDGYRAQLPIPLK